MPLYSSNTIGQTEQQNKSFKEFRGDLGDLRDSRIHRLPAFDDNRADLDALLELRDIEDELTTINKVFKEQLNSIASMMAQYQDPSLINRGENGIHLLNQSEHKINEYKEQVDGMLTSAKTAQKAFKELLDMKQKQANIVEAHLANQQSEVTADQSRSVMIFTIFTIVFLPLSFMAGVFGINAREWSGTSTNPSLRTIFIYMFLLSLAVIIIALLVAFNRATRRIAIKFWKVIAVPLRTAILRLPGGAYVVGKLRHRVEAGTVGGAGTFRTTVTSTHRSGFGAARSGPSSTLDWVGEIPMKHLD